MKHIAIFGDAHGHLRLLFQLCRLWQLEHQVHLDGIVVCGDLGFFPDVSRLDKATRRFALKDPEELGFSRYFMWPEPPERDELLERTLCGPEDDLNTVRCRFLWCHGNHEDFQELDRLVGGAKTAWVDCFERLEWMRSGLVERLAGVRLGVVGGGPEYQDNSQVPANYQGLWHTVNERACRQLIGEEFDVLVTHSGPKTFEQRGLDHGSELLHELVDTTQPIYHFYAHHTRPIPELRIGKTRSIWLNDVDFDKRAHDRSERGRVEPGCMGVLGWESPKENEFSVVDEPWFRSLNAKTWRHV